MQAPRKFKNNSELQCWCSRILARGTTKTVINPVTPRILSSFRLDRPLCFSLVICVCQRLRQIAQKLLDEMIREELAPNAPISGLKRSVSLYILPSTVEEVTRIARLGSNRKAYINAREACFEAGTPDNIGPLMGFGVYMCL